MMGYELASALKEGRKDFRGENLRGICRAGLTAPEGDFSQANLDTAYLPGAFLRDVKFTSAYLANVDLRRAYLAGADFQGAALLGAHFEGAAL